MTNFIIPVIVLFIIIYGLLKKVDIYDVFLKGVLEGLRMILNIFPTIFAMCLSINVLITSNIIDDLGNNLEPLLNLISFPKELLSIAIMRPISGSSSLVLLDNILSTNGVDSFIGRVASVLQGSTDTTIYILGLYFSSVGIKKSKYALIVGLLTDFIAILISLIVVSVIF